jgi:hypothetical protein
MLVPYEIDCNSQMYKSSRDDWQSQRELGLVVMDVDDVVNEYECEDKVGRNLEKNKIDLINKVFVLYIPVRADTLV